MDRVKNNQSFSVEDIRRIREEDSERKKNMTPAELAADIEKGAAESRRILEEIRRAKELKKTI